MKSLAYAVFILCLLDTMFVTQMPYAQQGCWSVVQPAINNNSKTSPQVFLSLERYCKLSDLFVNILVILPFLIWQEL